MKSKEVFFACGICSEPYSPGFLTSKTGELSVRLFLNSLALIECTVSISFPDSFQDTNPPLRIPTVLSKPTLESRVIVSCSLPDGVTNKIGCLISPINAPTQGAKPPSIPMKIDPGI